MNFYKKVSETQINPANVVDSFNTGDDKHTNAPSIYVTETRLNQADTKIAQTQFMITEEYLEGSAYGKGDYCIHNGGLYRSKANVSGGTWDSSKWEQVCLAYEVRELNAHPYIVETGTSGVWNFRKWSDGRAELWGVLPASVSSWAAWGNVFESTNGFYTTFPSWFSNNESFVAFVSYTGTYSSMSIETFINSVANSTPLMYLTRGATASGGYFSISMQARGRWQ